MKKRFLSLILAGVTGISCMSFLSACSKDGGGGGGTTLKPIEVAELRETTVKIAFRGEEANDVDNVVKAINADLKKDGRPYSVEFEFVPETNYITDIENMTKNEGLDAAFVYVDDFSSLLARGTLMNVSPYLEQYGSALKATIKDYAWDQVTNPKDGNIYAIPRNVPLADYKETIAVRKDWMDQVGITEINTVEDVTEYFAEISNTEGIGLEGGVKKEGFWANMGEHSNTFVLREYAPGYYFPIIYYAQRPLYIDITQQNAKGSYDVKNFYESRAFIQWTETATSWVDAGYTPEDGASSLTGHDYRFYTGMAGCLWNVVLKQAERIDEFMAQQPIGSSAALYDVYLNEDAPKYVMTGADNMLAVLSFSKNPNEAIDFFNWIRESQDNYDLFCYGVEGENYFADEKTIQNEDGEDVLVHYFSYSTVKEVNGEEIKVNIPADKRYAVNFPNWTVTDINMTRWSKNLTDEYILSRIYWEKDDENGEPLNYVVNPLIGFVLDETVPALKNNKANVMAAMTLAAEFADGRSALDEEVGSPATTKYARLLADLEAANIDGLIAEVQRQVDEFVAKKNAA